MNRDFPVQVVLHLGTACSDDSTFQPQKSEIPAEVLSTGSPFQTGTGE